VFHRRELEEKSTLSAFLPGTSPAFSAQMSCAVCR
jgi:hypothetical protein